MSIQTDLTRLQSAKAAIKAAIEGKGVTVPDTTLLDGMAALIESIEAGGGGIDLGLFNFSDCITGSFTKASNATSFIIWNIKNTPRALLLYSTDDLSNSVSDRIIAMFGIMDNDNILESTPVNGIRIFDTIYSTGFSRISMNSNGTIKKNGDYGITTSTTGKYPPFVYTKTSEKISIEAPTYNVSSTSSPSYFAAGITYKYAIFF